MSSVNINKVERFIRDYLGQGWEVSGIGTYGTSVIISAVYPNKSNNEVPLMTKSYTVTKSGIVHEGLGENGKIDDAMTFSFQCLEDHEEDDGPHRYGTKVKEYNYEGRKQFERHSSCVYDPRFDSDLWASEDNYDEDDEWDN